MALLVFYRVLRITTEIPKNKIKNGPELVAWRMRKGGKKKPVRWPRSRSGKTHGQVQGTRNYLVIELRQTLNIGGPQILLQMRQQAEKGLHVETHPQISTGTLAAFLFR